MCFKCVRNNRAKAIIFAIIRTFKVDLAIQPDDIVRRTAVVGRPAIDGKAFGGVQLPLLIRPVNMN
jgi:hypothetical protein